MEVALQIASRIASFLSGILTTLGPRIKAMCPNFFLSPTDPMPDAIASWDRGAKGSRVLLSGSTVGGSGTVRGNAPLDQDRCYWEVAVVSSIGGASFSVGIARPFAGDQLSALDGQLELHGPQSWALRVNDVTSTVIAADGDTIGVAFDQSDVAVLEFFLNGQLIPDATVRGCGIRGPIAPAVSVGPGAKLRANFTHTFKHVARPGMNGIIVARQIV